MFSISRAIEYLFYFQLVTKNLNLKSALIWLIGQKVALIWCMTNKKAAGYKATDGLIILLFK